MQIYSIYVLKSKTSSKVYVGYTSLTVDERWRIHVIDSKRSKNSHLHYAIQKYGVDDFEIDTIYQSLDRDHCHNEMESYFIKQFISDGLELYNIQPGGEGNKEPKTRKAVELYDKDFNLIETIPSIAAVARKLSCDQSTVSIACRNAENNKSSRVKEYWVCYAGSKPIKKDYTYMKERNQRIRPHLGKKRPDQSKFMRENNPRKRTISQ